MKRTPLKRKTQLKRGTKCTLKKSRLKPVSKKKEDWKSLYKESKRRFGSHVRCAHSGLLMQIEWCEPHHPFGQIGSRIMAFLWITRSFHKQIHDFGKQSYDIGWLQPEFRGLVHDDNHPRPWKIQFESGWPDLYKRNPSVN